MPAYLYSLAFGLTKLMQAVNIMTTCSCIIQLNTPVNY